MCEKGYVKEGSDPLEVAVNQLTKDNINISYTIGGDDTNTMAAQLFLPRKNGYELTVVGLPKTVDNEGTSFSNIRCFERSRARGCFF